MALFKAVVWALTFLTKLRFPPGVSLAIKSEYLNKFPAITQPVTQERNVKHNITHHIVTKGPPVYSKPRRLAPEKQKIAKSEFHKLLALEIIAPSLSCWAFPLHMVPTKTPRTWRSCEDYFK